MLTDYSSRQILDALCGKAVSAVLGATSYVGLSTTAPTASGTNFTEPVGNGYARVMIGSYNSATTQKMSTVENGETSNAEIIYFPEATGPWGTLSYFGIFSAQTEGNLLAYGELANPIAPVENTIPIIRLGDLKVSLL